MLLKYIFILFRVFILFFLPFVSETHNLNNLLFVMQGLSNRRVGATSINSESSRSHTVFTCVVESQCKVMHSSLLVWKLLSNTTSTNNSEIVLWSVCS